MSDATPSGTLPSVEGIESRPSRFSVEETLARTNSVTYLRELYAIPQALVGNLAVVDAVIQQALQS